MRGIHRTSGAVAAIALLLAACSGGGGTPTGGSQTAAASVCSEPAAGTATNVEASVGDNTWAPVAAKVGDVITWSNGDAVPHKVGLDDGSCTMSKNITGDAPQSLVFTAAGSYPFHCTVHPSMKGTIVIS